MEVSIASGEVVLRCGVWTAAAVLLLCVALGLWLGSMYERVRSLSARFEEDVEEEEEDDGDDDDPGPPGPLRPRPA